MGGVEPNPGSAGAAEPALTVAAVARRLGIAPATLRTWDRRYGLGPSDHASGRHRSYDGDDVARLEQMQRALLRGASPAEAARYALTAQPDDLPAPPEPVARVLRLPGASVPAGYARGFARAVLAMDSAAAQRLLGEAIAVGGVPHAWDDVVRPVLAAVTHRWAHTPDAAIETEHLLYECVLAALIRATPLVTEPCNPRPVLLAGAPGEQHTLPLYGLVATLAARGVGTRMLGPALPVDALVAAIRRLAPAVVVVWAQMPARVEARIRHRRTRLFLGGPGWRGRTPDLALADGMESAASEIVGVVR